MTFSIAPTDAGDIGELQAIERAANEMFRESGLIPFPAEGSAVVARAVHEELIGQSLSWTAISEGGPVGFLLGMRHPDSHYLAELAVDPAYGRRGIGAALVAHYCTFAKREGATAVTLSTFRDVPWNAPFYRRVGFADVPREAMTDWMRRYERNQIAGGLDVTKRLFMRKAL